MPEEITLAVIAEKINNITESNKEEHTILKETLRWQEEKRCKKNDLILETINKYRGEIDSKMKHLEECMMTRDSFDRFLNSENRRNAQRDEAIKNIYTIVEGDPLQGREGLLDKVEKISPIMVLYNGWVKYSFVIIIGLLGIISAIIVAWKDVIKK